MVLLFWGIVIDPNKLLGKAYCCSSGFKDTAII